MRGVEVRRSECPICPPWVLRCVHFEGQILVLSANGSDPSLWGHTCAGGDMPFMGEGYAVHQGPKFIHCSRGGDCLAICIDCEGRVCSWFYDDLPAAEAEFERRAEELRQALVEEVVDA